MSRNDPHETCCVHSVMTAVIFSSHAEWFDGDAGHPFAVTVMLLCSSPAACHGTVLGRCCTGWFPNGNRHAGCGEAAAPPVTMVFAAVHGGKSLVRKKEQSGTNCSAHLAKDHTGKWLTLQER